VFAFGDVSGKGAAAALYGALVSGLLRTLAHRRRGPAELLKMLNDVLLERKVDAQYVTLTVLLWESGKCKLTMANAGAIPPMICRDGEITKPKIEGVPAGLLDDREYEEIVFDAKPKDVIVLYSDGIQDQLNTKEEEYGKVRLARVLKKSYGLTSEAIADEILKSLDEFTNGAPAFDDQTMIVLKVR
jgi:sigma-B regulation protein RsbU (phosphoserine phosphatase)